MTWLVVALAILLFLAVPAMLLRVPWTRARPAGGKQDAPGGVVPDMAELTMYSTTWCGYCRRLKMELDEAGIGYTEINIESDPGAAAFVESVNRGNQVVPTVVFADGTAVTNPSFTEVQERLAA
jgi:mycoredoxin